MSYPSFFVQLLCVGYILYMVLLSAIIWIQSDMNKVFFLGTARHSNLGLCLSHVHLFTGLFMIQLGLKSQWQSKTVIKQDVTWLLWSVTAILTLLVAVVKWKLGVVKQMEYQVRSTGCFREMAEALEGLEQAACKLGVLQYSAKLKPPLEPQPPQPSSMALISGVGIEVDLQQFQPSATTPGLTWLGPVSSERKMVEGEWHMAEWCAGK